MDKESLVATELEILSRIARYSADVIVCVSNGDEEGEAGSRFELYSALDDLRAVQQRFQKLANEG